MKCEVEPERGVAACVDPADVLPGLQSGTANTATVAMAV
jgi:hypothetical protein